MQRKMEFRSMRCVLTLILTLCMVFSVCTPAFAAQTSGTCGDGLTWSFDTGTLTVEGVGTIPDYNSDAASEDAAPWAELRSKIKSLVISDGITAIGSNAFYGLENLTAITVPNSVINVGAYAFYNCIRVKELTIGENVTDMADYAFAYLKSLRTLCYNAISTRAALEQKQLEDGAAYIFSSVFYAAGVAGKGVEVIFGDKVVTIPPYIFGRQAYRTVKNDQSPDINSKDMIESSNARLLKLWQKLPAFQGKNPYPLNKIESVKFGASVEYIDACAFAYCDTLKSITFSESIQFIGSDAFSCGKSGIKLQFPNDTCFAAQTVKSCKEEPPVKEVPSTDGQSWKIFEMVHLVNKDDPLLQKAAAYPIELSLNAAAVGGNIGVLIFKGVATGLGIGIAEMILTVLLPVLPEFWMGVNIKAMWDYYSGYFAHTHL